MTLLKVIFCIFIASFLIVCCSNDDEPTSAKEYELIDERLWYYFEEFEKAGESRGIDIDYTANRIVAVIEEIETAHVGGQCVHPVPGSNRIVIDEAFFINTNDILLKELVIFHEIGHCLLARDHRDDFYQNGICKSLMRTGTGECLDNYKESTRKTYLDEMFDPDAF